MTKHTIILIISINLIMVQTIAARAYWNAVYQTIDNSFQDYCFETTGYYKTDSVQTTSKKKLDLFRLYPTVIDRGSLLNISSTESGIIRLMDVSGKFIHQAVFAKGSSKLQSMELSSSQIVFYDATTESGLKYNGKIFVK